LHRFGDAFIAEILALLHDHGVGRGGPHHEGRQTSASGRRSCSVDGILKHGCANDGGGCRLPTPQSVISIDIGA
jgi:hypothetical protein